MQITLTNTGKRFNRDWIFRHAHLEFLPRRSYAVTGPNGSGKSTLLQVIAGAVLHSEGEIRYYHATSTVATTPITIDPATAHRQIAIAAPYLDLIEEMTATEFLKFHSVFKPLIKPISDILELVGLASAAKKEIRYFSSGMKQRLKLAQAFFSDTSVLMLDEPTTNLDEAGCEMYRELINDFTDSRLVIVCSNDKAEYDFCDQEISILSLK